MLHAMGVGAIITMPFAGRSFIVMAVKKVIITSAIIAALTLTIINLE